MNLLKSTLRKTLRAKVAEKISFSQDEEAARLTQQLERFLQAESGSWGAFAALPDEPAINFEKLKTSVTWVYPRIEGEHIQFYQASLATMIPNQWGIREPNPQQHKPVAIQSLQGVCVPGLAFDSEGYRLGRGKGYYDRALQNYRGKKTGVAFSWQIVEEVPRESFDIRMDAIVTDKSIIRASGASK